MSEPRHTTPPDEGAPAVLASLLKSGQESLSRPPQPRPRSRFYLVAAAIGVALIAISLLGGQFLGKGRKAAPPAAAASSR